MIDLHCHILPGIDDGPSNMEAALSLAALAVANGIHTAVLTPHIYPARWNNQQTQLRCELEIFQLHLNSRRIPLQIRLGGEVRLGEDILPLLERDEIPYLGEVDGMKIMLLEFPDKLVPVGNEQLVRHFLQRGIRPLIAHPERNLAIQAKPDKLQALLDLGCWLQITAGSLLGQFGRSAKKTAELLMDNDWVYAMASDCHNADYRPPNLQQGHAAVCALHGQDYADMLVIDNPQRIIGNPA
ncbi:CpsB/CapC family capsule biosynthesis tyrosine phosphatase [Chitinibacter sp. FCG-7]|uniref:protein-tyrosine-phosphatase n=1 Tax=Chitinibacter mangrovi TaxID=3153927 RepID=A0AAU7F6B5_9NEIS